MAREASAERNTKETEIKLKINLDGTGYSDIETGVGFFDHMLDGFTRHGLFDSVSESMEIFRWMIITPLRIQELFWEQH